MPQRTQFKGCLKRSVAESAPAPGGRATDAEVATARELARGDRVTGMAAWQAELAHKGVTYDVVVDTTRSVALNCARDIARHVP